MDSFSIPPEYCLIVRAFGRTKSLREAADLLKCDPSALVRKAQAISGDYGLLQKIRGRWALTESGRRVSHWVEASIASQKELLKERPQLRISTPMWLAEQLVVPKLEGLRSATRSQFIWNMVTSVPDFESALLDGKTDYVIACYPPRDPGIAHRRVAPENWVVVAPASWKAQAQNKSSQALQKFLKEQPFIRHASVNPDTFVQDVVGHWAEDLLVDSLIGVRSAVENGHGWSCVPEILVRNALKNGSIIKLDLPVKIGGDLCLWWLRPRKDIAQNVRVLSKWLADSCAPISLDA